MKTFTSTGISAAAESKQTELLRGINRRDEQIQEAAALLLLLTNDLVRIHEQGGKWDDEGFSGFIAAGLIGISHKAAQTLYQATCS